MPGIHQNGRLHLLFHARKSTKRAASPAILGGSGHEIKSVAGHLGEFRAWVLERSYFFKERTGEAEPTAEGHGHGDGRGRNHGHGQENDHLGGLLGIPSWGILGWNTRRSRPFWEVLGMK